MQIPDNLKAKLKKIDFKDRKYVLPLLALPFVIFFAYQIYGIVGEDGEQSQMMANHNNLNDQLPDAADNDMLSRYDALNKNYGSDGYSAMNELEKEGEDGMDNSSSYTQNERNKLDSLERLRQQRQKAIQDIQRELGYGSSGSYYSPSPSTQQTAAQTAPQNGAASAARQYAEEIRKIQKQLRGEDEEDNNYRKKNAQESELNLYERNELERLKQKEKEIEETKIVQKAEDENDRFFHSVQDKNPDDDLIKAMIDQTIKVVDGTRIRLKLLNDVTIDSTKLEKGTYLYALVRGFSGQRVMANITSILVGNKFLKVNLSLYDNDGMEGFYVPASTFREMVKNVGANAVGGMNMTMNNGSNSMSGEYLALQAIQQAYSGVTQAVSQNIRKNKAKIKYNTVVYLINTNSK